MLGRDARCGTCYELTIRCMCVAVYRIVPAQKSLYDSLILYGQITTEHDI